LAKELLPDSTKEKPMSSKPQELTYKVTAEFEAGKKAFHATAAKAQGHIDAITAEINKLRADLKTQTAETKTKTMAHIDELTKSLDAARKEEQAEIEAHLKVLHKDIESIDAELKHASADGKAEMEATAKAVREECDNARRMLTASLEAELDEWKARIGTAMDAAAEKTAAAKTAVQAKIADAHAKHDAAQKKLHALKQANAAAFNELHHGVRAAIAEVKSAL
jgi:polyhydroxyalkanoate synthesis regulator phasin